jgi:hypothetical protein
VPDRFGADARSRGLGLAYLLHPMNEDPASGPTAELDDAGARHVAPIRCAVHAPTLAARRLDPDHGWTAPAASIALARVAAHWDESFGWRPPHALVTSFRAFAKMVCGALGETLRLLGSLTRRQLGLREREIELLRDARRQRLACATRRCVIDAARNGASASPPGARARPRRRPPRPRRAPARPRRSGERPRPQSRSAPRDASHERGMRRATGGRTRRSRDVGRR